ncbi:hypothetical protein BDZ91DRAFT_742265, partial [Kalaharituber pfeilii]
MQSSPQLRPQLTPLSKKKIPHTPISCRNPTPGKKKTKREGKKKRPNSPQKNSREILRKMLN